MTAALTDDEIEDRFFILNPKQIIAMLGQFIYKSIPVTVQFNNGNDFILTRLLEARRDALIFDLGGDPQANKRLLKSATCTFVTAVNGIQVQFSTSGGVKQVWWGDADAFSVKLPTRVVRLQRRDAYRITIPVVKTIPVRLQYNQLGGTSNETCPIHDLSISGLGVTFPQQPSHETGETIERVTFVLPEQGEIECGGIIRHVTNIPDGSHNRSYRMGIAFKKLPRQMEIAIQRYIIAIELIRRKVASESG